MRDNGIISLAPLPGALDPIRPGMTSRYRLPEHGAQPHAGGGLVAQPPTVVEAESHVHAITRKRDLFDAPGRHAGHQHRSADVRPDALASPGRIQEKAVCDRRCARYTHGDQHDRQQRDDARGASVAADAPLRPFVGFEDELENADEDVDEFDQEHQRASPPRSGRGHARRRGRSEDVGAQAGRFGVKLHR